MQNEEAHAKQNWKMSLDEELKVAFEDSINMTPNYLQHQFQQMDTRRQQQQKKQDRQNEQHSSQAPKNTDTEQVQTKRKGTIPVAIPSTSNKSSSASVSTGDDDKYEKMYWYNCFEEFMNSKQT